MRNAAILCVTLLLRAITINRQVGERCWQSWKFGEAHQHCQCNVCVHVRVCECVFVYVCACVAYVCVRYLLQMFFEGIVVLEDKKTYHWQIVCCKLPAGI